MSQRAGELAEEKNFSQKGWKRKKIGRFCQKSAKIKFPKVFFKKDLTAEESCDKIRRKMKQNDLRSHRAARARTVDIFSLGCLRGNLCRAGKALFA